MTKARNVYEIAADTLKALGAIERRKEKKLATLNAKRLAIEVAAKKERTDVLKVTPEDALDLLDERGELEPASKADVEIDVEDIR